MLLRLIYIVTILVILTMFIIYNKNSNTTIKEIHHYHIYDTKQNYERKKAARKLMKEILYGYEYKPILPKEFKQHWQNPPGNNFNIFPGVVTDKIFR